MGVKRSYLFVPATSEKMMVKAVNSDADCIIIDLEDAVAINEKDAARERAKQFLLNYQPGKDVYIRINSITTPYWEMDIEAAVKAGAFGIVVPKAENAANMKLICCTVLDQLDRFEQVDRSFDVLPLIETAAGVHFSYEIANAHHFIKRLVFGSIDYALDIGCESTDTGEELIYARSQIVNSSKAAGIDSPVDAVYPDLSNEEGLNSEAVRARRAGFKAKLAIHPKQLGSIHRIFTPREDIIDEALEIIKAFEEAEKQGIASISVRNKLVDYPVYKKAKELIKYSRA
ncbi:CoA ester lyase [Schinkia azotoformans]|uniref:HpcH/HpaI aldolase/citrate lyase family protein n=1 Tax=Schinkia azotoformans TaxID=1454 RepID=UPI002E2495CC|nr:CoA ester lyase [Schinkia azotoformans]